MSGEDFEAKTTALLDAHGADLIALAAASIRHGLAEGTPLPVNTGDYPADLGEDGACFVTLKRDGQLRGCIGSPEARQPLVADVVENAYGAAFRDPRFPALTTDELNHVAMSISVLSPSTAMTITGEADLLAQLRPGVDGLIIQDGPHRALFLPAVWRQLPEPEQFLAHLKAKAGIGSGPVSPGFTARRFIAAEISDTDEP